MGKKRRMKQCKNELIDALKQIVESRSRDFEYSASFLKRELQNNVSFNFYHNNQVGQLIRMSPYKITNEKYNHFRRYNLIPRDES